MELKELKYQNYPAYLRYRYHVVLLRRLLRRYRLEKLSVLDIGGGGGLFSYFLDTNFEYMTLDIDQARIDAAKKKNIPALLYDGTSIPLPEKSVDVVLCSHTLEHVPVPGRKRLLEEMKRVSRHSVIIVYPKGPHPLEKKALAILEDKGRQDLFVYQNIKDHLHFPRIKKKLIEETLPGSVFKETSNPWVWMVMSIYLRTHLPSSFRVPVTYALDPFMRVLDKMKPATTLVAFYQHR